MHISFTAHDSKSSTSSSNLIEYLDKENQLENEKGEIQPTESYFNSDYDSINSTQKLNSQDIINNLDSNRGSQKLISSNFYMLNVSPSKKELEHMEKIADTELKNRGLLENNNKASQLLYKEQKEELMKMQLKLYTKDVMTNYAQNFNREIYVNEDKLPNNKERKIIEEETNKKIIDFLVKKNYIEQKEYERVKWGKEKIVVNNISIINENERRYLAEFDFNGKKIEMFLPKAGVNLKNDGVEINKTLYQEKEKEFLSKTTEVEIKLNFLGEMKTNDKILKFEFSQPPMINTSSFYINKDDVRIEKNSEGEKFFTSQKNFEANSKIALLNLFQKEFPGEKEKFYESTATNNGFDLTKRPLTEKDLMWYAKVEMSRTFKRTDKWVQENVKLEKEIKELKAKGSFKNHSQIESLKTQLHKNSKGEAIKAGDKKEGNQHHVHIVVSRHDKTMKNPRNKISLSPLSNAKDSSMKNGAKVGFDRNTFFQNSETIFDKKFGYDRPKDESYEKYKKEKTAKDVVASKGKGAAKQFILKHSGITQAKSLISPVQDIKKELGIAKIPTQLPKNVVDLAYKVVKNILSKGIEIN